MPKQLPEFNNEDEERAFWAENDSADYIDWSQAERVELPNLKRSTKAISIRLTESMVNQLKVLANKRDVPYQSLIKMFLQDRINAEFRAAQTHSVNYRLKNRDLLLHEPDSPYDE